MDKIHFKCVFRINIRIRVKYSIPNICFQIFNNNSILKICLILCVKCFKYFKHKNIKKNVMFNWDDLRKLNEIYDDR